MTFNARLASLWEEEEKRNLLRVWSCLMVQRGGRTEREKVIY